MRDRRRGHAGSAHQKPSAASSRSPATFALLPQPGRFEGVGVVEKVMLPNHPAVVVEGRKHGVVLGQRDAAALSARNEFGEHEKAVAQIDQLARLESVLTPAAGPLGRELAIALW